MRKFWIEFHKISGLIILIPLLLQSISGSVIVFDHAIDEWLNPELLLTENHGNTAAPVSDIINSAMMALPGISHINSLRKPRHDQAVYTAYIEMESSSPDYGKRLEVLIDPFTAEVTGIREWGNYFTSFIYLLHFTLLMDEYGELFLGFMAILILINLIIGIYLGWPRSKAAWDWLMARNKRVTPFIGKLRRWHILMGLTATPVFVVLIISGISMIFHVQTDTLLSRPHPPQLKVDFKPNSPINPDNWLPAVQQYWPDAEWMRISPPTEISPAAGITLRQPGDPRQTTGSSMLWLHPQSSTVLAQQQLNTMGFLPQLSFWLFPLHSGEALGLSGRLLVFITGFLTTALTLVGGWLWYRRKFR
ncbi:PepSY-associated TM helix domain-containing protein [Methylophaga sp. OBS4]|uniref:PepSY-associated TM helix domain-containing protein n=1 Tax=Methylophaga sp. OBS4 TaxID=2991935 RepID=UPI0022534FDB|nr:PepSY-associated TM helix domain-containing protein [Methylophaga sp. OBS4]MCX4186977.1 PepSY domain-containing protein [Methylophaga sp. OBS4]